MFSFFVSFFQISVSQQCFGFEMMVHFSQLKLSKSLAANRIPSLFLTFSLFYNLARSFNNKYNCLHTLQTLKINRQNKKKVKLKIWWDCLRVVESQETYTFDGHFEYLPQKLKCTHFVFQQQNVPHWQIPPSFMFYKKVVIQLKIIPLRTFDCNFFRGHPNNTSHSMAGVSDWHFNMVC